MNRLGRQLVLIAGIVVLIPATLYVALWVFFAATERPSKIVDFHPESFQAKAESAFFYSIGKELKYSDQIDPHAPTLLRGRIQNFLVSPDNKRIAVVANGKLLVVGTNSVLREVGAVDSIYREPKPIGQQFFRDDEFQWSRDSKILYLVRDEYYQSQGSQLFSSKGELWKYDVESGDLRSVIKPFPSCCYFLGGNSGVYFSSPTGSGDLQLRYSDGNGVTNVGDPNAWEIPSEKLNPKFVDVPFYSFSIIDYERAMQHSQDIELVGDGNPRLQKLVIRGKPYLATTEGQGFKGPYHCADDLLRSTFLPGDRYFFFNVDCGNYEGQLLIDTVTGKYERLPAGSVVYVTLNTDTYRRFRVTGGGIVAD